MTTPGTENPRVTQPRFTSVLPTLKTTSIFRNWKFKIVLFLEQNGIHDVLLVKVKHKLRKKEDLRKKDAEARLLIAQSIEDKLLDVIRKCKTAREMITKLDTWFQRKTAFTKYDLRKKLLTMKFTPSDNLQAHFLKFDQLISDLEATGCKLEESDKVCHLLLTLPDEYQAITTSLDDMMGISESKNIVRFVKNHLINSVMRATGQTTCSQENGGNTTSVTVNSMDDGIAEVKSETLEEHIYELRENLMSNIHRQSSESISIDDTNTACTDRCSPETCPEADENQCPESTEIKLNPDLDLVALADSEPFNDSVTSNTYDSKSQLELFDEDNLNVTSVPESAIDCYSDSTQELNPALHGDRSNNLDENTAIPEPTDAKSDLDSDAGDVNNEAEASQLSDSSSMVPHGLVQSDDLELNPSLLEGESPEEQSTSEMFCCNVVLQDAANRLWCACCGQWCFSDTELQRHKLMHAATTQNITVDQSTSQAEALTGTNISACQETTTSNTTVEHETNSDNLNINSEIPQTESISPHSSQSHTEGTYITKNQSGINHLNQHSAADANQSGNSHFNSQTSINSIYNKSGSNSFNLQTAREKPTTARLTCHICEKTFAHTRSLSKHVNRQHVYVKPVFSCDKCSKSYTAKNSLEYHFKSAHSEERPFSCNICDKTFVFERILERHVQAIHVNGKPFECSVCHQSFATKFYLSAHMNVHNRERKQKCEVCDKNFRTKKLLKKHKLVHSDQQHDYMCHVCGKTFLRKTSLYIHKSACYGTEKFICNECGESFTRKSRLISHLHVHNKDKPFKCKICKKRFVRKLYLDRHEVTHGERQYSCNICGQRFFYKSTLNRHMKAPHSDISGPRWDRPPRR